MNIHVIAIMGGIFIVLAIINIFIALSQVRQNVTFLKSEIDEINIKLTKINLLGGGLKDIGYDEYIKMRHTLDKAFNI